MSSSAARGSLLVVAAPSGAGKTSLVNAMLEHDDNLVLSVSHTTRPPRPGEIDGRHYHFTDAAGFDGLVEADAFLEHATVFDHRYGTHAALVEDERATGHDVLLEIDWQGAAQVRARDPACVSVFIVPPSLAALRERLSGRGQDSAAVIERRMRDARTEMSHWPEFDFLVINDVFDVALDDLLAIVRALRLRRPPQAARHHDLLEQLAASR